MATSEEAVERGRHAEAGLDRTQPRGGTIYFIHASVSPSDWRVQFPLVGSPQPQDPTHRLQAGCHLGANPLFLPFPPWQVFLLIAALPPHPPFCSLSSESDSESAACSREPIPKQSQLAGKNWTGQAVFWSGLGCWHGRLSQHSCLSRAGDPRQGLRPTVRGPGWRFRLRQR